MERNRNVSSLSEHKLHRKQGRVATPINDGLGDKLVLSSWTTERMPEYLWLGLILMDYGREEGFQRAGTILSEISKKVETLSKPKLSKIFKLSREEKIVIYQIILNSIDASVLSPLTVLYRASEYPDFNDFFYVPEIRFEKRIKHLNEAIKIYSPHQSNAATDLRFLILSLQLFGGRIHVADHLTATTQALSEYPFTDHDDEKMRRYRPTIRSMEGAFGDKDDVEFSNAFWIGIGMITKCSPFGIAHKEGEMDYQLFIKRFQKILEYVLHSYKNKSLTDDKFDVIVGSITYALKVFNEVHENSLSNGILGRHGARTIIEIYIILKYLLKREVDKPNIWQEYKLYGISKYKLVLLKARESALAESAHFIPQVADILINEIRWEEFIDVDLKYFDKQGIREKSIEVGEKRLFDLFYDYDSSFAHGLWGAVRESSMLTCDNVSHHGHIIPDIFMVQTLPDVKTDCFNIMNNLLALLIQIYPVPDTLLVTE